VGLTQLGSACITRLYSLPPHHDELLVHERRGGHLQPAVDGYGEPDHQRGLPRGGGEVLPKGVPIHLALALTRGGGGGGWIRLVGGGDSLRARAAPPVAGERTTVFVVAVEAALQTLTVFLTLFVVIEAAVGTLLRTRVEAVVLGAPLPAAAVAPMRVEAAIANTIVLLGRATVRLSKKWQTC
jgi:hypothetical protein